MANFPAFPTSGKNAKVSLSNGDGTKVTLATLTKSATKKYRGIDYANLVYLLGAGKTLLNMRPALFPTVTIDGITSGLDISPGIADKVSVTAGTIDVDGTSTAVAANTAVALTIVSAASTIQWNAIVVDKTSTVISAVAGTPIADTEDMLDTFGDEAGERPLIPINALLIGWVQVGATGVVPTANINYFEREYGAVEYDLLPNLGGCKLQKALTECHSATIGGTASARSVKMTAYYLDAVLTVIGTAKDWNLTARSSSVSDESFASSYNESNVTGFNWSANQLAADKKAIDATWLRQGHCAVKLEMPNGFAWQSVATIAPTVSVAANSMNGISIAGVCGDFPEEA